MRDLASIERLCRDRSDGEGAHNRPGRAVCLISQADQVAAAGGTQGRLPDAQPTAPVEVQVVVGQLADQVFELGERLLQPSGALHTEVAGTRALVSSPADVPIIIDHAPVINGPCTDHQCPCIHHHDRCSRHHDRCSDHHDPMLIRRSNRPKSLLPGHRSSHGVPRRSPA
jgi:hypothetical protein